MTAQVHAHVGSPTVVYTLDPSTHGNPEGIAWDSSACRFYVGGTGDGAIYRGKLGDLTVRPFIDGTADGCAVGMKVFNGRLYVAGGPTGRINVYDLATGSLAASFETGAGGLLNDLVITQHGDVYVTDSFRPTLWQVKAADVAAGGGTPRPIDMGPEIVYQPGVSNLNGIVEFHGGKELLIVSTATGELFRISIDSSAPSGRRITTVDAPLLVNADGMILDRGRLVVVIGDPAKLVFLTLSHGHTKAHLVDERPDPSLIGPSSVIHAEDRYLVVNADFATSKQPFTVSGLARRAEW